MNREYKVTYFTDCTCREERGEFVDVNFAIAIKIKLYKRTNNKDRPKLDGGGILHANTSLVM